MLQTRHKRGASRAARATLARRRVGYSQRAGRAERKGDVDLLLGEAVVDRDRELAAHGHQSSKSPRRAPSASVAELDWPSQEQQQTGDERSASRSRCRYRHRRRRPTPWSCGARASGAEYDEEPEHQHEVVRDQGAHLARARAQPNEKFSVPSSIGARTPCGRPAAVASSNDRVSMRPKRPTRAPEPAAGHVDDRGSAVHRIRAAEPSEAVLAAQQDSRSEG